MGFNILHKGKAPKPIYYYPTWANAQKDLVSTTIRLSRFYFTMADGIITEVFYPRIDTPQVKDIGFIVADNSGFWVELKKLNNYTLEFIEDGIPALIVHHKHERFKMDLKVCPGSKRDVLLIDFNLYGDKNLKPYVMLNARLNGSADNLAWVDNWESRQILWAYRQPYGLALLCRDRLGKPAFGDLSVGHLGESDIWQDFNKNGRMSVSYNETWPGDVVLGGSLPQAGTLALGLASSKESAAMLAWSSLMDGFETAWNNHIKMWSGWHKSIKYPDSFDSLSKEAQKLFKTSINVIKVHEDHSYAGAIVASLSTPWGESSQSQGGYHLVWSRDLVETATALIAIGLFDDARDVLCYLIAAQQEHGYWLQNLWLSGQPFWQGIQLDETAFPILLAAQLAQYNELKEIPIEEMIKKGLYFIMQNGPSTDQDRWEEDSGINTFTLGVAIAALVEGANFLEGKEKDCALMLADYWNMRLEDWTFVSNTDLSKKLGVKGYYMRIAPKDALVHKGATAEHILIKNRAKDPDLPAQDQISTDFLQLCRYGLRDTKDFHILESIKAVDKLLKTDTPSGAVWHRYNGDGYGEHIDGSPFDGTGKGRGWPLLVGERGHFALLNGQDPKPYMQTMVNMCGKGGLLPEQVWDSKPIEDKKLYPGKPSGSAMPLVWAHAEFIKLCLSTIKGYPVDRPANTFKRYKEKKPQLPYYIWSLRQRFKYLPQGKDLYFFFYKKTTIHWGINNWQNIQNTKTQDWGIAHVGFLNVSHLKPKETIEFTFYYDDLGEWQNEDFKITITGD